MTVDEGTVEVAHEALLREWPRLRGWLEEDAEGRRLHQHLIHAAARVAGLRARSGRALPRRPARLGARLGGRATTRELNELEREFLDESRAASEREAERQRRTNRRLRTLLAGVGVLLAAAVVAGVIAISERQGARSAATVADRPAAGGPGPHRGPPRPGAPARQHRRRARRLGRDPLQPALDAAAQPRRARRPERRRRTPYSARAQPRRRHARGRRLRRQRDPLRHRDAGANRRLPGAGSRVDASPSIPGRLARDRRERDSRSARRRTCRSSTRALCGCASPSRSVPIPPAPDCAYFPTAVYAPDGRSLIVSYSSGDLDYSAAGVPAPFRRPQRHAAGKAVRVAPGLLRSGLHATADGRLIDGDRREQPT